MKQLLIFFFLLITYKILLYSDIYNLQLKLLTNNMLLTINLQLTITS